MYALGDRACFLRTALDTSDVYDKFLPFAGTRLFFLVDITSSEAAGKMFGSFGTSSSTPLCRPPPSDAQGPRHPLPRRQGRAGRQGGQFRQSARRRRSGGERDRL